MVRVEQKSDLLQGVVTPATIVVAFSAALSPLYNWLLVDYFEIGLAGAALANDAVQVSIFAFKYHTMRVAWLEGSAGIGGPARMGTYAWHVRLPGILAIRCQ